MSNIEWTVLYILTQFYLVMCGLLNVALNLLELSGNLPLVCNQRYRFLESISQQPNYATFAAKSTTSARPKEIN